MRLMRVFRFIMAFRTLIASISDTLLSQKLKLGQDVAQADVDPETIGASRDKNNRAYRTLT